MHQCREQSELEATFESLREIEQHTWQKFTPKIALYGEGSAREEHRLSAFRMTLDEDGNWSHRPSHLVGL